MSTGHQLSYRYFIGTGHTIPLIGSDRAGLDSVGLIESENLIENRRYTIWSGAYVFFVLVFGYCVIYLGFPISEDAMRNSTLALIATALAGLIAIYTTLSALAHMLSHKNYAWFIATLLLVYISAYLYGLFVVTKPNREAI